MSRYTALTLTLHVILTLAVKQGNSDTEAEMPMPEISPTISPSLLSEGRRGRGREERKPKFLVSAVTTTTTLSTFTICYTAGTLTAPCKKKKREIPSDREIEDFSDKMISRDENNRETYNIDR